MDTEELSRLCKLDKQIAPYFIGVFPSDKLPKKILRWPGCLIANTKKSDHPGEHWIALYFTVENTVEYFCSFGEKPDNALAIYLKNENTVCNKTRIQSTSSTTCGQHCLFYLHFRCRNMTMSSIVRLFSSKDILFNDHMVTGFINGLYGMDTVVRDRSFIG
jgi:hypothetical protein